MRVTVFHGTKQSYVQAVINDADLDVFRLFGFVDSVDIETGLCETCEDEYRHEQYYKHGIGEPHEEEV